MLIFGLLDGGGSKILHRFGFGKGHLGEGGLDTEASSHDSEPIEKLCRQTVTTSRI